LIVKGSEVAIPKALHGRVRCFPVHRRLPVIRDAARLAWSRCPVSAHPDDEFVIRHYTDSAYYGKPTLCLVNC
jgi:hypothetical protein